MIATPTSKITSSTSAQGSLAEVAAVAGTDLTWSDRHSVGGKTTATSGKREFSWIRLETVGNVQLKSLNFSLFRNAETE